MIDDPGMTNVQGRMTNVQIPMTRKLKRKREANPYAVVDAVGPFRRAVGKTGSAGT